MGCGPFSCLGLSKGFCWACSFICCELAGHWAADSLAWAHLYVSWDTLRVLSVGSHPPGTVRTVGQTDFSPLLPLAGLLI